MMVLFKARLQMFDDTDGKALMFLEDLSDG